MEYSTGKILQQQNKDEPIPPASFAKMLTLYVVFDLIEKGQAALGDEVFISEKAWRTGGSKMFVREGERVPLEELIKGIAVVSGNDCVRGGSRTLFRQRRGLRQGNERDSGQTRHDQKPL